MKIAMFIKSQSEMSPNDDAQAKDFSGLKPEKSGDLDLENLAVYIVDVNDTSRLGPLKH
jgi:hypothetical protein